MINENHANIIEFHKNIRFTIKTKKSTLGVTLTELVEDGDGVESGVLTQLTGDDLKSLGVGGDQELLLTWEE